MHRRPLFILAVVALLPVPFLMDSVSAQDATPAPAPESSLPRQMVVAINATDSAALAALYAEDAVHEDVPAGITAQGREEIAAFVEGTLGQFSEVRIEPVSAQQAGNLAVLEYIFSVTDAASGQPLTYRGVLVFELDGDLISRSADYYDLAALLGHLGQIEPGVPTSEATPAS
jgi:steroid delta-isomerase-like uncharacterized protein